MGVWTCSRKGCDSIMPDRRNSDYNICDACLRELLKSPFADIGSFMESVKDEAIYIAWEKYLNEHFPVV